MSARKMPRYAPPPALSEVAHRYRASTYLDLSYLPRHCAHWCQRENEQDALSVDEGESRPLRAKALHRYIKRRAWIWPDRPVYFLSDLHADAAAFLRSLAAAGLIDKFGPQDLDFRLAPGAQGARVIIGGDCFDKGPHNLELLVVMHQLRELGVELELVAGNHDLRALVGFAYIGRKEPLFAHLYLRMGRKSIPLLRELNAYVQRHPDEGAELPNKMPSERKLEALLFPQEDWWQTFPEAAQGILRPAAIQKELRRIREKLQEFKAALSQAQMSLQDAYKAGLHFETLFLRPNSRFAWFFRDMKVITRHGSLLFVHAGVCDTSARWLREGGVDKVQSHFEHLRETDLFSLYNGPIGNLFRTKYRDNDLSLTMRGVRDLQIAGIHAIVHGHRNVHQGQRLALRGGMLNFECDASLDRNTRSLEGLSGPGSAATLFLPGGRVLGISSDSDFVKSIHVGRYAKLLSSRPLDPI